MSRLALSEYHNNISALIKVKKLQARVAIADTILNLSMKNDEHLTTEEIQAMRLFAQHLVSP